MILAVWTVAASLGAAFALWNAIDAFLDWLALPPGNGVRLAARGEVRREIIRFGIQADWVLVGLLTMLGIGSALIAPMLVASAIAVAANTLLDARDRHKLHRILGIARDTKE